MNRKANVRVIYDGVNSGVLRQIIEAASPLMSVPGSNSSGLVFSISSSTLHEKRCPSSFMKTHHQIPLIQS